MSAQVPMPVAVGDLVAGKYRVERQLGHGGMGVVVAAMHETLRQRVAIKMLLPEAKASANALARFMREARAAAAIHGEHVARVLDVGELDGGAPFIVMEFLEGTDLSAVLAERNTLPVEEAVGYLLEACEAIAEAHAAGIVHRDLKPSNLFLARRPDGSPMVKVLDFGISKALLVGEGEALTTTSSFVGSPTYSPPEQLLAAHDVDARADVWSLGTILYEALAGRTPFVGDSVMHVASRIFHESPTPLDQLRPDLPAALRAAVMRCLAKKPDERFEDVHALAAAIAPFAPGASISAERVARIVRGSSSASPSSPGTRKDAATPPPASRTIERPSAASRGALLAGLLAAGIGLGYLAFGRARPPPAEARAAAATALAPAPFLPASAPAPEVTPPAAEAQPAPSAAPDATPSGSAPSAAPSFIRPVTTPRRNPLSVGVK